MTLPGGVLLVLDEQWDQHRINTFFATSGIARGSVEAMDFAPNAFFIDTSPAFLRSSSVRATSSATPSSPEPSGASPGHRPLEEGVQCA